CHSRTRTSGCRGRSTVRDRVAQPGLSEARVVRLPRRFATLPGEQQTPATVRGEVCSGRSWTG
ncbi:MAG: hypothetical protein AVDCRST_MAG80-2362, partial [uncultured Rubrobacteraceae bacterium]